MTNFYRTLKLLLLEINTNKPKVTQNILKEIQAPTVQSPILDMQSRGIVK